MCIRDSHTAIWLVQIMGDSFHWLDHYAASQQPLAHYLSLIHI